MLTEIAGTSDTSFGFSCHKNVRNFEPPLVTAGSLEDETRNGHRNGKRNPNGNQETTVLGLFSNFQMKRDLEK